MFSTLVGFTELKNTGGYITYGSGAGGAPGFNTAPGLPSGDNTIETWAGARETKGLFPNPGHNYQTTH